MSQKIYLEMGAAKAEAKHEGNTEEENNGYVVFKWYINAIDQLENRVILRGGSVSPPVPSPYYRGQIQSPKSTIPYTGTRAT